jgi:tryptophan 2,3-dioxygenase
MTTTGEAGVASASRIGTEFNRYVRSGELLSLQDFRTDAPGEPSFLIITQTMELLFKLAYLEAATARGCFAALDVDGALTALRRLRGTQRVMIEGWEVLSALSPTDYLLFRDALGDGSGFQSYAYRRWEFILGKKNPDVLLTYLFDPVATELLHDALAEPSMYDVVLQQFGRYGLNLPADVVVRDWTKPRDHCPSVEAAWRAVYADAGRYAELYRTAEQLTDIAYEFARWQAAHVLVVERVLGAKRGTAGTSGIDWLRRSANHRVFGELWTVRGEL